MQAEKRVPARHAVEVRRLDLAALEAVAVAALLVEVMKTRFVFSLGFYAGGLDDRRPARLADELGEGLRRGARRDLEAAAVRRSTTARLRSAFTNSSNRRSITGRGVPAGAAGPNHCTVS